MLECFNEKCMTECGKILYSKKEGLEHYLEC